MSINKDEPMVIGALITAGLLISGIGYYLLPLWFLASCVGLVSAALAFVIVHYREELDSAKGRLSRLNKERATASADKDKALQTARELQAATAEKLRQAESSIAALNTKAAQLNAQIGQLNGEVNRRERLLDEWSVSGGNRISELEDRLATIEPDWEMLRYRENIRLAWRTLPQGHDLESEQFAAAVAAALR